MKYQVVGDYVLEYEYRLGDFVDIVIWKTHRENILPFSEVICQIQLKPTIKDKLQKVLQA